VTVRADGLERAVLDEPRELDQEKELVVLTLQVCVCECVRVWRIGKSNVSCWYARYWTCVDQCNTLPLTILSLIIVACMCTYH
jgi:hypothetical protein